MADYSLGSGYSSGYGSGGLGLGGGYGGGYGGSSGLGLGGGGNNYGGGWGGGYGLADGYTGSYGLGLNTSSSGGGFYDANGNYNLAPSWWGHPAFSSPSQNSYDTGFSGGQTMGPLSYGFDAPGSSGLGLSAPSQELGFTGNIGLTMPSGTTGYGLSGNDDPNPGFWGSDFGKKLKQVGLFALRVHPATRTPMAVYGALDSLFNGQPGQGLGTLVGMATKNPLAGGLVNLGVDAFNGKPVAGQMGSRIGGMAGGMTGGPVGAALGSMAGSAIGQGYDQGRTGPAPASQAGNQDRQPGDTLGAGLTSLAALWMANKQNKTAQQYRDQQAQQAQTLQQMFAQQQGQMPKPPGMRSPNLGAVRAQMESMFGAGSKTAATLRTQLERKDAASGRRSQYGPREVELLARLAQLRAQAEPSYMNAEIAAANAANQHAAQMYSTQQQAYNNYIQNMLRGQQLGGGNQSAAYQAQQAADLARQQQLAAILYGARETGLFDAAANWWGS